MRLRPRFAAGGALVGAVSALVLAACSFEVVVTPAAQAATDWNELTSTEQAQYCDVYVKDPDLSREVTYTALRDERGWTNTDSMVRYWLAITENCSSASTPSESSPPPSRPVTPSAPQPEGSSPGDATLGQSGYPVANEDAYLAAVRADKTLGRLAATSEDQTLLVIAVPICVTVREEGVSRAEMAEMMQGADFDPRYVQPFIRAALDHLCPA